MRIGIGYDVHRLVTGRKLILGGVRIPHEKGLLGHSDADVLVHAVCDALLGAAGLGDIGQHFPDKDPRFEDADSIRLLAATGKLLREKALAVGNLDATIMAENPKLSPYRPEMAANIARALDIQPAAVNIKATTTEGLGFIGTGEGMAAMCIACLVETRRPPG